MTRQLEHSNGELQFGGIGVRELAQQFDTPTFITDGERVLENYRALQTAFADYPTTIAYACKANTGLALMQLIESTGASIDAVSLGEVEIALRAGFSPDRIHYTGTNPRCDHLQILLEHGVHINIDSVSIARRIAKMAEGKNFGLRINPNVGAGHHEYVNTGSATSKFGLHPDNLEEVCALLHEHGHRVTRLHAHTGSGIHDAIPIFVEMIAALQKTYQTINEYTNVDIDTIDIGGGFNIPYRPDDEALDINATAQAIITAMRQSFPESCTLLIEPGRYVVADSTILLSRATSMKTGPHNTYVGLDTGMHQLIRPALYESYHQILAAEKMDQASTHRYHFTGPICESADVLGTDRHLPELDEGDLIAICDAGAYGMTMASTFNSNPLPAEVIVRNGQAQLVRDRGTVDDLLYGQHQLTELS